MILALVIVALAAFGILGTLMLTAREHDLEADDAADREIWLRLIERLDSEQ